MTLSEETGHYYSERRKQFDRYKRNTPIGIFGSFYVSRKPGLLSLKEFLLNAGYHPRISEDLDTRKGKDRKSKDPVGDRELSERLIAESDIHLFVLVRERENEPGNLIQSVSMEIQTTAYAGCLWTEICKICSRLYRKRVDRNDGKRM